MLHAQTVAASTLELLRKLLALSELADFVLVGGTNLALRFGHRISVDIDLFTTETFNLEEVQQSIHFSFPNVLELTARKQTLLLNIDGIKTDIIRHAYPVIQSFDVIEGIRLMSLPDVAAMKLGAIAGRGAKKDFWDIHALRTLYTLDEMLSFYTLKYPNSDAGQVLRSLVYFEDADEQPDPIDLKGISWEDIKQDIFRTVKSYINESIN